jgi:hypothetical protein
MGRQRRIRISERHAMEGGVRCPGCGRFNALSDIVTTGACRGRLADDCGASLALDLVVES